MTCEWQFDGQCCRTRLQLNADAESGPSWASVAEPEKVMTSPTFHVVPATGASMVAVGGVFPTLIVTESVSDAPFESVTRSDAG